MPESRAWSESRKPKAFVASDAAVCRPQPTGSLRVKVASKNKGTRESKKTATTAVEKCNGTDGAIKRQMSEKSEAGNGAEDFPDLLDLGILGL